MNLTTLLGIGSGSTSAIKSVQRGTLTFAASSTSQSATITAVNTNKAYVNFLGATSTKGADNINARIELASTTSVLGAISSSLGAVTMAFEVIEFN